MLLSKAIKLVAAFDHRHIFIDPDPDPATSWKERKRLFNLQRSSWADYNTALVSKGGGIFPRSQKRIALSKKARDVLGIVEAELDPDSLIAAILKSPADLIWFGGIGTYIKGEGESHAQVGDPGNDAMRVNALDLRAKVIGEGANLGVTQAGRIEFALNGGRINTDFIDNSAGVDCSDNEVNIKIALAAARKAGRLSEARRNALLVDMTDEVAELVLEDNRLQALSLSIAERGGAEAMASQIRLIEALEEMGELDRKTEGLAASDFLSRRAADGHGMTRPELAVLLSSCKLVLQDAVEASGLAQDSAAEELLLSDFPPQMRNSYRKALLSHRLRREIVGTVIANRIVNRMGMVHPFELAEEAGAGLDRVACAFVSACSLLEMDALWESLENARISEHARLMLFEHAAHGLRSHMADLLRAGGCGEAPSRLKAELGPLIDELSQHTDSLLGAEARAHVAGISGELIHAGAPPKLAQSVARLFAQDGAFGLAMLARDSGIAPVELAVGFVELGSLLGLDWAQSRASVMSPSDPWERLLVAGLARDFQQMRLEFLGQLAANRRKNGDLTDHIGRWARDNQASIAKFRSAIARAQASAPTTPAALAQIASQARNLLTR
jgi:glutamate dehydrogenase